MASFGYIIDKIKQSPFTNAPYEHIYIDNLFSDEHFQQITQAPQINIKDVTDDEALFQQLFDNGYKIITFPGCVTDKDKYIASRRQPNHHDKERHSACLTSGITLRLATPEHSILAELKEFLEGQEFNTAVAEKFGLDFSNCTADTGIQKYLDGYEISPHPDVRRKATTFMVNINPHDNSEQLIHHTHYMTFKEDYKYVKDYWAQHDDVERAWVPWEWCETQSIQTKNNSMVLFAPSNDSVHAVKADYNHLASQRTQLYGNQWFKDTKPLKKLEWEELGAKKFTAKKDKNLKTAISGFMPKPVKKILKKAIKKDSDLMLERDF